MKEITADIFDDDLSMDFDDSASIIFGEDDMEAGDTGDFDDIRKDDLFTFGEHRLLCGDSRLASDVERVLQGETPDAIFFDPPYEKDLDFCMGALLSGLRKMRSGNLLIMASSKVMMEIYGLLKSIDSHIIRFHYEIVWNRITPSLSRLYSYPMIFHNLIHIYGVNGGYFELSSRSAQSVTGYARLPSMISLQKDTSLGGYNKPIGLMLCLMDSFCKSSCLDLFAGTGTTMSACELTGRRSFSIEYEPSKVKLILNRFRLTSDKTIEKL